MIPTTRKMLWVSLGEAITIVERLIEVAAERQVRDGLVVRLAQLDREVAELRDKWGMPELPVAAGKGE
ncbi:MAG: hypothetical protein ABFC88_13060 [Thermoguttaceae bacterium]